MIKVVCPLCAEETGDKTYTVDEFSGCCECCYKRVKVQKYIEEDPEVSSLNGHYIKWKILQYLFFIVMCVCIMVLKDSLDGVYTETVGIISAIIAPALAIFVVFCGIMRGIYSKRIKALVKNFESLLRM